MTTIIIYSYDSVLHEIAIADMKISATTATATCAANFDFGRETVIFKIKIGSAANFKWL